MDAQKDESMIDVEDLHAGEEVAQTPAEQKRNLDEIEDAAMKRIPL